MTAIPDIYVGFAFAWADVLLQADDGLIVRDASGAAEHLLGRPAADLHGAGLDTLLAPAAAPRLAALGALEKGRRLTLDRIQLANGQAADLCALRMEAGSGELCVALRARAGAAKSASTASPPGQRTYKLERFAERAQAALAADPARGIGVVALETLDALTPRLDRADADRLGDSLAAVVQRALGPDSPYVQIETGAYAYVDRGDAAEGDAVGAALADATRAIDPDNRGAVAHTGRAGMPGDAGLDERDLVNGLVCALAQFCEGAGGDRPLAELTGNFGRLVADGVGQVRAFTDLLAQDRFQAAFQPIVDLRTGRIRHFEALCRFDADTSPGDHLLFAERAGMIHQFDLAMVAKVLAWLGRYPRNRDWPSVAVNLSGHSLARPDFVQRLERLLDDAPWAAARLAFEITETMPIADRTRANDVIQRLRRRRHKVCIDDFGAGAASFQYLGDLAVDCVKFDGSALSAARRDRRGTAFLSALTQFCTRLGIDTVAECVETAADLELVRGCGVGAAQGYLFGRPDGDIAAFRPLPNARLLGAARRRTRAS
jgi:EAL domain-containing protein (putative c-di-GMP-specific phosphodiesterase class I)